MQIFLALFCKFIVFSCLAASYHTYFGALAITYYILSLKMDFFR